MSSSPTSVIAKPDETTYAPFLRSLAARRDARSLTLRAEGPLEAGCDTLEAIEKIRHQVYAVELKQYAASPTGRLDEPGKFFVIAYDDANEIAGYVSITAPPNKPRLSKQVDPSDYAACVESLGPDASIYEIRSLTLLSAWRGSQLSYLLMHAAGQSIRRSGGTHVIAIGKTSVLSLYRRLGMRVHCAVKVGAVNYSLMTLRLTAFNMGFATACAILLRRTPAPIFRATARLAAAAASALPPLLRLLSPRPLEGPSAPCYHGGSRWAASGFDFAKRDALVVADVLDAPFPPSPAVRAALTAQIGRLASESPPTHAEPLVAAIAAARGVPADKILVSSGSSSLLFSLLPRLLTPRARVLVLDPSYAEYEHVLTHVVGCKVERLAVNAGDLTVDLAALERAVRGGRYDMVCLVNPNSPTGQHAALDGVVAAAKAAYARRGKPIVWVDETYIDYVSDAGGGTSLEPEVGGGLFVCKSLSKVVPLAGLRVAYLAGDVDPLRRYIPPWPVSLPAQLAATVALGEPEYYRARRDEVRAEREVMRARLIDVLEAPYGVKVLSGCANFFLLELPKDFVVDAPRLVDGCRGRSGVYLRPFGAAWVRIAVRSRAENERVVAAIVAEVAARGGGEAVAETPAPRARFDPWSRASAGGGTASKASCPGVERRGTAEFDLVSPAPSAVYAMCSDDALA